jgi:hypothetical protein
LAGALLAKGIEVAADSQLEHFPAFYKISNIIIAYLIY